MTISDRFNPRGNSINALRLGLAALVLISHSLTLTGHFDPIGYFTGGDVDLGTIAVDGFFALSGFLIAGSFVRAQSVGRFVWHRCLRILPGFWVCLLITATVILPVAQLLEYHSFAGFPMTGQDSVAGYVWRNSALYIDQFQVRGLMGDRPVNGSLYTLFFEFVCYLGIAAMGALGLLQRRIWVVLAAAGILWALAIAELVTGGAVTDGSVVIWLFLRLGSMFAAGTTCHLLAARIPLHWLGGVAASLLLVSSLLAASIQGSDPLSRITYLILAPPAVVYLVLLGGCSPRLNGIGRQRDLSYGVYVYAWPIQMLLLLVGGADWPFPVYLAVCLSGSLAAAWVSWTLVESPALAAKSWTPRWLRSSGASRRSDVSAIGSSEPHDEAASETDSHGEHGLRNQQDGVPPGSR